MALARETGGGRLICNKKIAMTLGCLLAATLLLISACREEEQGRVLWHEKGVYMGTPHSVIPDGTLVDLRHRAAKQKDY